MIGSPVIYRVPSSTGWLQLRGTISNITDTAVVVKERLFGGKSTIDPSWLVSYDWSAKQTATAEAVAVA